MEKRFYPPSPQRDEVEGSMTGTPSSLSGGVDRRRFLGLLAGLAGAVGVTYAGGVPIAAALDKIGDPEPEQPVEVYTGPENLESIQNLLATKTPEEILASEFGLDTKEKRHSFLLSMAENLAHPEHFLPANIGSREVGYGNPRVTHVRDEDSAFTSFNEVSGNADAAIHSAMGVYSDRETKLHELVRFCLFYRDLLESSEVERIEASKPVFAGYYPLMLPEKVPSPSVLRAMPPEEVFTLLGLGPKRSRHVFIEALVPPYDAEGIERMKPILTHNSALRRAFGAESVDEDELVRFLRLNARAVVAGEPEAFKPAML